MITYVMKAVPTVKIKFYFGRRECILEYEQLILSVKEVI